LLAMWHTGSRKSQLPCQHQKFKRRRNLHEKRSRFRKRVQGIPKMSFEGETQASIVPDLETPCTYLQVSIDNRYHSALFDTGSPISVVTADLCGNRKIMPYMGKFRSCTGHSLDILGYATIEFDFNGRQCPIPCIVVSRSACPVILGMNWIVKYVRPEDQVLTPNHVEASSASGPGLSLHSPRSPLYSPWRFL